MKKTLLLKFATLIALIGLFALPAFAQKEKRIGVGKSGKFHIGSTLRIGDKTLEAGMYQIQHLFVSNEHFLVIRVVKMSFYRNRMSEEKLGQEVARVKCTVKVVEKQNKSAKILTRRNAAGEREAFEIWFRGEKVKHLLLTS